MNEIGHEYDFDDQFFRMVTISLANILSKNIRWINKFEPENENETGFKRVFLPFYTSLTGEERFVFDAFIDDIVDKRVSMNTDQLQRGMIEFKGFTTNTDQLANPNQYLSKKVKINSTIKKIISKVKAVPVTLNFDIQIQLATVNEIDKVSQKLLTVFYNYFFFNFDYYGLKIDAFFPLPDDKQIEIQRELNLENDRKKKITFSLDVNTYFPIFDIDIDDLMICDNDDSINWDELDIPRPTIDFNESLKKLNETYGQVAYSGSIGGYDEDGNPSVTGEYDKNGNYIGNDGKTIEGKTQIKKVYWYNMYRELDKYKSNNQDVNYNPSQWNKEDFDGVDPGESSRNNDLDNE